MSHSSSAMKSRLSTGWGAAAESVSWPLRLTDLGLALLILVLPFIWGGRQAMGNFATVMLAGWTAFWWAIYQIRQDRPRLRFSGAEPLLFMAIALVIVQTLTLPDSVRNTLSPEIARLLPSWSPDSPLNLGLGTWSTLSFAPWQSSSDLVTVISLMAVFFVGVQRIDTIQDVHRMIRCVAVSGCLMASFGLVQYFTSDGRFFWFYTHPDTTTATAAKGAFTNANHFASYLSMALPAQLWWYITDTRRLNKLRDAHSFYHTAPTGLHAVLIEWGPVGALIVTIAGVILSNSRGGLLVAAVGMTLACGLFWRQKLLETRALVLLLGVGVFGVLLVMMFGQRLEGELAENAESIRAGEVHSIDTAGSRERIWNTDLKVVQQFPITGTGLGTHALVYPSYYDYPEDYFQYTHAENGYLQVALETGITGLTITTLLIALVGYWVMRGLWISKSPETGSVLVVIAAGLTVNLVHSWTDFVWYVPGCMVVVVLLAAAASGVYRLALPPLPAASMDRPETGRLTWGVLLVLVVMGMGWGTRLKWPEVVAEPHYLAFRRISNDPSLGADRQMFIPQRHAHIVKAVLANPHDPVLLAHAARSYRRVFLVNHARSHEMPVEEIEQAAIASGYATRAELIAWLDIPEVMGRENRQHLHRAQALAIRAVRHCPLMSQPYLEVAQTSWINLTPAKIKECLYQQALTAQPYNGVTLTRYADYLLVHGRVDDAHRYYRDAYVRDGRCRTEIIRNLSRGYPIDMFLTKFPIDLPGLTEMREAYRDTEDRVGYRRILTLLAEAEMNASQNASGTTAAAHVVTAHGCYVEAGDNERALAVLRNSAKRHSNSFTLRYNLGSYLLSQGQFAEALPHLEWCMRRKPDDATINQRVALAIQGRPPSTTVTEVPLESRIR